MTKKWTKICQQNTVKEVGALLMIKNNQLQFLILHHIHKHIKNNEAELLLPFAHNRLFYKLLDWTYFLQLLHRYLLEATSANLINKYYCSHRVTGPFNLIFHAQRILRLHCISGINFSSHAGLNRIQENQHMEKG